MTVDKRMYKQSHQVQVWRLPNDKAVAALKPEPGRRYAIEFKDPDHVGFYLRLSYGGSKQFFFRYKRKQKQFKISLGNYDEVSCADLDCPRWTSPGLWTLSSLTGLPTV